MCHCLRTGWYFEFILMCPQFVNGIWSVFQCVCVWHKKNDIKIDEDMNIEFSGEQKAWLLRVRREYTRLADSDIAADQIKLYGWHQFYFSRIFVSDIPARSMRINAKYIVCSSGKLHFNTQYITYNYSSQHLSLNIILVSGFLFLRFLPFALTTTTTTDIDSELPHKMICETTCALCTLLCRTSHHHTHAIPSF